MVKIEIMIMRNHQILEVGCTFGTSGIVEDYGQGVYVEWHH